MEPAQIDRIRARTRGAHGTSVWRVFAFFVCCAAAPLAADETDGKIVVSGIPNSFRADALARIQLDDEPCNASRRRIRRLLAVAQDDIRKVLQIEGYYSPTVVAESSRQQNCWRVVFDIDIGPPVLIRNVIFRIDGEGSDDRTLLKSHDPQVLLPGQRFRHAHYETSKQATAALARSRGYFDARYTTNRIDVYPQQQAADIVLIFETGTRYRFGEVTLTQDVLTEGLVRRFIDFDSSTYYDAKLISELYKDFYAANYFESVDIVTQQRPAPDFDVPLDIRLTAAKPQSYTGGVGFATDTGLKVRGDYVHRRLNRRGHQFELNGNFSRVVSDLGTSYRLPLRRPREEWLNFDTGFRYENTDTSRSNIFKVGAKHIRLRAGDWVETRFVDVGIEDFEVADESGRSTLVIPGVSWIQRRSFAKRRPDKGHTLTFRVSGSAELLLSEATFLQAEATAKYIWPLWAGARIIGRADVGFTATDDFDSLPASVRYFAGGDTSVRGYAFESLGPENANGDVVGGNHRFVASLEIDQLIRPNWSVALFADAGNAFDDFKDIEVASSIGAGIRWYSPLGPIRVDFAVPLDDDAPDNFRIHITLGPDL